MLKVGTVSRSTFPYIYIYIFFFFTIVFSYALCFQPFGLCPNVFFFSMLF